MSIVKQLINVTHTHTHTHTHTLIGIPTIFERRRPSRMLTIRGGNNSPFRNLLLTRTVYIQEEYKCRIFT